MSSNCSCCSFPRWNFHRQNHNKMVNLQASSLIRSHLLVTVKFSAYLLLLLFCCFAETNSAYPTSSRQCRGAHCSKEMSAAPAACPLLCAIINLKAFSQIFLCVFDLLWPTDIRGLLSFLTALSAGSLAIALHQATPLSEGVSPTLYFPPRLLVWLWGRHRDLKPHVKRENKTPFLAAVQS